jgi:hypothetical protein
MDPLSVSAGVFGLLSESIRLASKLKELARTRKEPAAYYLEVSNQVSSISQALEAISDNLNNADAAQDSLVIRRILQSENSVLERLALDIRETSALSEAESNRRGTSIRSFVLSRGDRHRARWLQLSSRLREEELLLRSYLQLASVATE